MTWQLLLKFKDYKEKEKGKMGNKTICATKVVVDIFHSNFSFKESFFKEVMNVCKAVSQRPVSWNVNAKTASIQLLKFGCNVVISKLCLQAIDILVTVSEILILKIKAVAASNLLSFTEKEWAALLQSQLFSHQNK